MRKLLLIGTVAALALAVQPAFANLVSNPSFEIGTDPGAGFIDLGFGSTAITGWTVTDGQLTAAPGTGSIDYIGGLWQAADGVRSLDLDGFKTPGGISQTIATTAGTNYNVSFWLSGNPGGPPTVKVAVGDALPNSGISVHTFTYDTAAKGNSFANMMWEQETFSFTASSASTLLSFQSGTDPLDVTLNANLASYGAAIDNVSVTASGTNAPVPEPVTMFSAFLAISGLGAYIRKRTKATASA